VRCPKDSPPSLLFFFFHQRDEPGNEAARGFPRCFFFPPPFSFSLFLPTAARQTVFFFSSVPPPICGYTGEMSDMGTLLFSGAGICTFFFLPVVFLLKRASRCGFSLFAFLLLCSGGCRRAHVRASRRLLLLPPFTFLLVVAQCLCPTPFCPPCNIVIAGDMMSDPQGGLPFSSLCSVSFPGPLRKRLTNLLFPPPSLQQ